MYIMIEDLKLKILQYLSPDPQSDQAIKSLVPFGFTGMVLPHFTSILPAGFVLLDGAQYAKDDYPDLWRFLSEDYTSTVFEVDSNNFVVPDVTDRVLAGVGSNTNFNSLHKKSGAASHTLTVAQMPSHNHSINRPPWRTSERAGSGQVWSPTNTTYNWVTQDSDGTGGIQNTGGGQAHNNVQPSYAVYWIMKT